MPSASSSLAALLIRVLRMLLALSWLALLPVAQAGNYVLERAYWTDASASASFEQSRSAPYTPYPEVLAKGFSPAAEWVRVRVAASPPGERGALVVRIRPNFLDQITLYDPLQLQQGRAPVTVGDWTPWQLNIYDSLNHTVSIPASDAPRDIWLRMVSRSTHMMYVEVLSQDQMLRSEHNLWMGYSALLAIILLFLLMVFLAWLRDRDPVNGWFTLRQTVLFIHTACYLGYHRVLLEGVMSPLAQDQLYNWMVLFGTGFSVLFEYRLLADYHLPRWTLWLQRLLIMISLLAMTLVLSGHTQTGLQINLALNVLAMLAFFVIVLQIKPYSVSPVPDEVGEERYRLPRKVLAGYHLGVLVLLALAALPSMGVLRGSLFALYGILLYSVVSGVMMTTLLILRSRRTAGLRRSIALRLMQSQQALAAESRRREGQAQLLDMLIHELKTPLSVIDLAVKAQGATGKTQAYVGRAVDNMNAILERCVQTDRMVEQPLQLRQDAFDLVQQVPQWLEDCKVARQAADLHMIASAPLVSDLQCVHIIAGNLFENAYKYGDPQQPVRVTVLRLQGLAGRVGVALQVANGIGVAGCPDADKVFTRYYRNPAAQRASGTGLGLFLSHQLAFQLGGELRYEQDQHGVCFTLWLPV